MALTRQVTFVPQDKIDDHLPVERLAAFDSAGGPVTVGGGAAYTLPKATAAVLGGVKIGDNITIASDGAISAPAPYALPAATANALGGVKLQVFDEAIGNANSAVAKTSGESTTKAEFDALVDAYNALAAQFNRLISGLASSGVIKPPASSRQETAR